MEYRKANLAEVILFIAILSGPPSFRERDLTASLRGELDLSTAIQVGIWLIALGWVVLQVLKRRGKIARFGTPQLMGLVLGLVLILSAVVSPAPSFTLFRGLQVLIALLFTFFWVNRYGILATLKLFFFSLVLLMLIIYASYLLDPSLIVGGDQYGMRIKADLITPAAPLSMLIIAFLIVSPIKLPSWVELASGILAAGLMILARNRTAFIAAGILAMLSILTIGKKWSPFWKIASIGLIGALTLILAVSPDQIISWIIRNPNQISTFSERLPLWNYLIVSVIERSPIIGLGYSAASRILGPEAIPGLGNAHSTFVEILVGGGLSALFFYIAIWGWVLYRSVLSMGHWSRTIYTYINLLIVIFLFSLTTSFGVIVTVTSFAFWLVLALWVHEIALRRRIKRVETSDLGNTVTTSILPPGPPNLQANAKNPGQ